MPNTNVTIPNIGQYEDGADIGSHENDLNPANNVNVYKMLEQMIMSQQIVTNDVVTVACNRYEQNSKQPKMTQPLGKDSPQLDHRSLMVMTTHIEKLG